MSSSDAPRAGPPLSSGVVDLEMVCVCSDEDLAAAQDLARRTLAAIGATDTHGLVSQLLYSLRFTYGVELTDLAVDMWFAVVMSNRQTGAAIRVECDRFEDGLVAVWQHLAVAGASPAPGSV